jgi:hypothetical protein
VPGVQQRPSGVRRQRLDPERGGERHVGTVEPVGLDELGAQVGIVVGEQDLAIGLAGHLERPAPAPPEESGSLLAAGELRQQRLGPEVLMNVNAQRW